jgi:hypothetical protein
MHKLKAGIAYSDEDPLVIIIPNLTYGTEKWLFRPMSGLISMPRKQILPYSMEIL